MDTSSKASSAPYVSTEEADSITSEYIQAVRKANGRIRWDEASLNLLSQDTRLKEFCDDTVLGTVNNDSNISSVLELLTGGETRPPVLSVTANGSIIEYDKDVLSVKMEYSGTFHESKKIETPHWSWANITHRFCGDRSDMSKKYLSLTRDTVITKPHDDKPVVNWTPLPESVYEDQEDK